MSSNTDTRPLPVVREVPSAPIALPLGCRSNLAARTVLWREARPDGAVASATRAVRRPFFPDALSERATARESTPGRG